MRGRRGETDYSDDYTPATDLVFSLFAMTILLLAITGAGGKIRDQSAKARIGFLVNDIAGRQHKIDDLSNQCQQKPPALCRAPAVVNRDEDLATVKALPLANIQAPADGSFASKSGVFAPAVLTNILSLLSKKQSLITGYEANEIVFQISTRAGAGLEESGTGDSDLLLTMRWGEALVRALWTKPLPMACIFIEPLGSARAVDIIGIAKQPGSGKALAALYKAGQLPYDGRDEKKIINRTIEDTRVAIWLRKNPASPCSAKNLSEALAQIKFQ